MEQLLLWLPYVLGVLLAISEMLALIPTVKSNSVFTWIWNSIKWAKGLLEKK